MAHHHTASLPTDRRCTATLAACVLAVGCTGPTFQIDANGPVYLDGARTETGAPMPFSYYGTKGIDALPNDASTRPDWSLATSRTLVEVEAPVSPWLFPLDLPIELLLRPFEGTDDRTVTVAPDRVEGQVNVGFQPEGIEPLRARAFAARPSR
jgi:hypothetical protein